MSNLVDSVSPDGVSLLSVLLRLGLLLNICTTAVRAHNQCVGDTNAWSLASASFGRVCSRGERSAKPEEQRTDVVESYVLSQKPLVYLYKNCITQNEKKELLKLAAQRLTEETNSGFSSSLYLRQESDAKLPILKHIAKLAGKISGLPWKLAESVSLTKYTFGQNYGLHYDSGFYMQEKRMKRTGTFLVYLNDVESGGETIFPYATNDTTENVDKLEITKPPIQQVCSAKGVLKIPPKARHCVLFYNHQLKHFDKVLDSQSLHGSCPVLSGEKWIAQIWLHDEPWGKGVTDIWTD